MQLYLGDCYGVRVPGTEFWITVQLSKRGSHVTIQLPAINFQTGPYANNLYEVNNPESEIIDEVQGVFLPPPQNGGYLYTMNGFLPPDCRPNEVINLSFFAASNNANNIAFKLPANANPPPEVATVDYKKLEAGYVVQITNFGALVVQGMSTKLGNIIPPGHQSVMPTSFGYFAKPKLQLAHNTRVSFKEINTAVFPFTSTNFDSANNALRDSHVNDAFDNVVALAWADNSNVRNKTLNYNTMNLGFTVGRVDRKTGKLKFRKPIFISTPENFYVWDTAVCVNRLDKRNIVVSWNLIDNNSPADGLPGAVCYRAVSYDGGKTFPLNGPTNLQPAGGQGAGDNRGVSCDKYGNIWYLSSNLLDASGNLVNSPFLMVSTDKGDTYNLVYTFPENNPNDFYDFGQMAFGGDGSGNYGVYVVADYVPNFATEFNGHPVLIFLPIFGLGSFGTAQLTHLSQFENNIWTSSLTASVDGRLWMYGSPEGLGPGSYVFPGGAGYNNNTRLVYKSPGALSDNFAGPWTVMNYNALSDSLYIPLWKSQPLFGMFQTVQNNLYDEARRALYLILNVRLPKDGRSQIYFVISRDNGQTLSNFIELSDTDKANRGFPSMTLDERTGNLIISWYDGRHYDNLTGLNFYAAVIEAKELDDLVNKIPSSNPVYSIPSTSTISTSSTSSISTLSSSVKTKSNTVSKSNLNQSYGRLKGRVGQWLRAKGHK